MLEKTTLFKNQLTLLKFVFPEIVRYSSPDAFVLHYGIQASLLFRTDVTHISNHLFLFIQFQLNS